MQKQTNTFAVETKDGTVQNIGKSVVYHPAIKYNGEKTKWFDDNKLIRKK